jgi:glyoxylase-like metal-dependent hydrolase (beta-lactamase superfamily II)
VAVVVVSACADSTDTSSSASPPTSTPTSTTSTTSTIGTTSTTSPPTGTSTAAASPSTIAAVPGGWNTIAMPNTTAYALLRGGEVTLVDTGLAGSAPAFESVLTELGVGWDAVGNIIVTHGHADHAGGAAEFTELALDAVVHVSEADAAAVGTLAGGAPRFIADGDRVFDLDIIATPGHTLGHVSVLDAAAGVLVAGDALNNRSGLASASADVRFTADGDEADRSVRRLAGFDYEVVLMGHGGPVTADGAAAVAALADALGV